MARKRMRSGLFSRNVRRRLNFGRRIRRRRTGGRRTLSYTSQATKGSTLNYRARRLPRRAWNRALWRDTLFKTHYRSGGNQTATIQTGTVVGQGPTTIIDPFFLGTPGPTTAFWVAAGGFETPDTGATPPTFGPGDKVIRGGTIGLSLNTQANTADSLNVKVFTIRLNARPDFSLVPGVLPYGARLDSSPDFTRNVGRIIDVKEAALGADNPSFTIIRRLSVQKIDTETFDTYLGNHIIFIVAVANMSDSTDTAIVTTHFHDLSFTADPIT